MKVAFVLFNMDSKFSDKAVDQLYNLKQAYLRSVIFQVVFPELKIVSFSGERCWVLQQFFADRRV